MIKKMIVLFLIFAGHFTYAEIQYDESFADKIDRSNNLQFDGFGASAEGARRASLEACEIYVSNEERTCSKMHGKFKSRKCAEVTNKGNSGHYRSASSTEIGCVVGNTVIRWRAHSSNNDPNDAYALVQCQQEIEQTRNKCHADEGKRWWVTEECQVTHCTSATCYVTARSACDYY